jgi:hypothetical protein
MRILHNEELHYLYAAKYNYDIKVSDDEMGRTCSKYGEKMIAYRVLVGKREWKTLLARRRCRW